MSKVFYKALAFWEAVSWLVAGVVGLLAYFNVIPIEYAYSAPVILAGILAVLKFFQVPVELRAKGLL